MLTILIRYKGINASARKFVNEMISSGVVEQIRKEQGNLSYEYFFPQNGDETVLLVDSWINQEALDKHHELPLMNKIKELRESTPAVPITESPTRYAPFFTFTEPKPV